VLSRSWPEWGANGVAPTPTKHARPGVQGARGPLAGALRGQRPRPKNKRPRPKNKRPRPKSTRPRPTSSAPVVQLR
jgi:hypothetical protein